MSEDDLRRDLSDCDWNAVEAETRIFAVGFYDSLGTWFFVWERSRPNETYSHELAESPKGAMVVRYSVEGSVYREMLLGRFVDDGLPADGDGEHAAAYRAVFSCIQRYDSLLYSDYPESMWDRETVFRAYEALQWYERQLERR